MDGVADIQRITPLICPQCGDRVELCNSGHVICWKCGELYVDEKTNVWKIRKFYNDYNDRNVDKTNNLKEENQSWEIRMW